MHNSVALELVAPMLGRAGSSAATVALRRPHCEKGDLSLQLSPALAGGGIGIRCDCSPRLTHCIFIGNSAGQGGGMSNSYNCNSTLINCIFIGNSATNDGSFGGGGMFVYDSGQTLINCLFFDNSAVNGGGMDYSDTHEMNLINCVFSGNSANYGGAMHSHNHATTVNLYNCSFSKNSANYFGGAIYNGDYGTTRKMELINCILWGNNDSSSLGEFSQIRPSDYELSVSYCDIQGGWEGTANINADPCFADANNGDHHLKSQAGRWDPNTETWVQDDDETSPCIDAGNPMSPIMYEPFPNGGIINMGAYGGTSEASKSYFGKPPCEIIVAGDMNGDCLVNFLDFRLMALHWCEDNNP